MSGRGSRGASTSDAVEFLAGGASAFWRPFWGREGVTAVIVGPLGITISLALLGQTSSLDLLKHLPIAFTILHTHKFIHGECRCTKVKPHQTNIIMLDVTRKKGLSMLSHIQMHSARTKVDWKRE
jgi:hypothetical protein